MNHSDAGNLRQSPHRSAMDDRGHLQGLLTAPSCFATLLLVKKTLPFWEHETIFNDRKTATNTEVRSYFKILQDDPGSRIFAPLAEALVRRGRLADALQICEMGLESNPDFADGHLAYARVLFFFFRHQDALEEVKVTLGLDAKNADAYLIAAEIYLSRNQQQAATEACMRALDLEPHHPDAKRILERIAADNRGQDLDDTAVASIKKQDPSQGDEVEQFRATAGTAPGRRLIPSSASSGSRPLSDPFRQLLDEVGKAAAMKVDSSEQPFSTPPDSVEDQESALTEVDPFDLPTLKTMQPRPKTPVPELPELPKLQEQPDSALPPAWSLQPNPEDVAAVPVSSQPVALATAAASSFVAGIPTIDAVQTIIESYAHRLTDEDPDDSAPKMPRSSRILLLIGLLLILGGIAVVIVFGMEAEVGRQTERTMQASSTQPWYLPKSPSLDSTKQQPTKSDDSTTPPGPTASPTDSPIEPSKPDASLAPGNAGSGTNQANPGDQAGGAATAISPTATGITTPEVSKQPPSGKPHPGKLAKPPPRPKHPKRNK